MKITQRHKLRIILLLSVSCIFTLYNVYHFVLSNRENPVSGKYNNDKNDLSAKNNSDILQGLNYLQDVLETKTAPSSSQIANASELIYNYGINQYDMDSKELFEDFARAVRVKFGLPQFMPCTPFEKGISHFIADSNGFLPLIKECKKYILGSNSVRTDDNIIWYHLADGFVCERRGRELFDYIKKGLPGVSLEKKNIVDIGGGTAVLSAMEVQEIGLSAGKIICIDVVPVFKKFADYMKKYDERYTKIDYRIASMKSVNFKEGEADIITLMDMHMLRFNSQQDFKDGFLDIKQWLESVSFGLKDDGYLIVYDMYNFDGQEKMTEEILESCGFYVENRQWIQRHSGKRLLMTLRKRQNKRHN